MEETAVYHCREAATTIERGTRRSPSQLSQKILFILQNHVNPVKHIFECNHF